MSSGSDVYDDSDVVDVIDVLRSNLPLTGPFSSNDMVSALLLDRWLPVSDRDGDGG